MKTEEIKKLYTKGALDIEGAMDALADEGYCPNLLNDDAGHWAFAADGFQSIVMDGPCDVQTAFHVKKECWKDTINEAFLYFLDKLIA